MRARRALAVVVLLVMGVVALTLPAPAGNEPAGATPAPIPAGLLGAAPTGQNVVVVLVDDMTVGEMQFLPKVQSYLGDQGVTFDRFFDNTPLCCPARATLLTGQHSRNNGVTTNKPAQGQGYQALDHTNTLATWFQTAGYDTTFIGKYLNGYGNYSLYPGVPDNREVPPGWSNWNALVGNLKYFRYTMNRNGKLVTYGKTAADYQTDVIADIAVSSIERSVGNAKPFFLFVAPLAPHLQNALPPVPAPRHAHAFDGLALPQPPNFNEADVSDKPGFVKRQPLLTDVQIAAMRTHYEARAESLQAVDDAVERIYQTLEATGQLDNTMIVFASDNGYMFGNHRIEGKVRVYEESAQVPLVIRGGGFSGGAHVDAVSSNIDLAPTIAGFTGIIPQRVMDGLDLRAVAADPAAYDNRAVLIESVEGPGYRAIHTKNWLWVEYAGTSRELYDLVNDPYELTSLHKSTAHASVRNRLHDKLLQLLACSGANCDVRD